MLLKEYLLKERLTRKGLSELLNTGYVHTCLIIQGKIKPGVKFAKKIEELTKNKVTYEELLEFFQEREQQRITEAASVYWK